MSYGIVTNNLHLNELLPSKPSRNPVRSAVQTRARLILFHWANIHC